MPGKRGENVEKQELPQGGKTEDTDPHKQPSRVGVVGYAERRKWTSPLWRLPQGAGGRAFYMKQLNEGVPVSHPLNSEKLTNKIKANMMTLDANTSKGPNNQ